MRSFLSYIPIDLKKYVEITKRRYPVFSHFLHYYGLQVMIQIMHYSHRNDNPKA